MTGMRHITSEDERDSLVLREAAQILAARAKRRTFALAVIIRVLERAADRIN
jgi:hypothetical protein